MNINYPDEFDTPVKRTRFLHRLQELMKRKHNIMGKKFKDGEITSDEWYLFKEKFEKRNMFVCQEICKYRELIKNDENINIDTENIFIE